MVQQIVFEKRIYDSITEKCIELWKEGVKDVIDIATSLMSLDDIPIHHPYHHCIVPASLLTAANVVDEGSEEKIRADLTSAMERATMVPGGFCGTHGACGAGLAAGIFYSIYTDTTPYSEKTWAAANRITAEALLAVSEVEGPRCCKRCGYLALKSAVSSIERELGLVLEAGNVICRFSDRNQECKKEKCMYYKGVEDGNRF